MVVSEIKDLNSSREVADLGGSGREFPRRMVSGKKELRWAFTLDRGMEKLLGCLEEADGTRSSVGVWTRLFLIL